jgi:hypothetical protein
MVRFDVRNIAILFLLAASAAQAQPWRGPAAVEIRVEDQKGLPVAGAQVQLQYTALNPLDGPAAVLTDARGHATIGGLAEGPWRLAVSHDGFMTYQVEVNVREGGRPATSGATQIKVSGSLRTMEVQISRSRSAPAPPRPAPAPVPAPVRPVQTQPAPRPEPSPAPAPPPQPTPSPTPQPASAPQPVKEPPATQPVTPPLAPQPTTAPPAPTQPAPAPKPVPSPAPAPVPIQQPPQAIPPPAPAPAPVTPPPAAPPADRLLTSKDRNCVECQLGETALSLEWTVSPTTTAGCAADIATRLASGKVPAELSAGCHVLRIALPAGARYTAYRYEVMIAGDSVDCPTGKDCPRNLGRWPMDPVLNRAAQGTVVLAPFEPGPSQAERRAVLTVYFTEGKPARR